MLKSPLRVAGYGAGKASAEKALAAAFMLGLLVQLPGLGLVPASVVIAAFFALPLLSSASRGIRTLTAWTVTASISGLILLLLSLATDYETGGLFSIGSVLAWLLAIPLLPAMAEWSSSRLSVRDGIALMLIGALASTAIVDGPNWKGSVGIYATALALVLLSRWPVLSFGVLVTFTVLSLTGDARSMAVGAISTVAVVVFSQIFQLRRGGRARTIGLFSALTVTAILIVWGLASGIGGEQVQARTLDQLSKANALFGARAEFAAAQSLFLERPSGFGLGVIPSEAQVTDAILAVSAAGGDWTSFYFDTVVFGDRVDLHSTASNLWFHFGLPGLALAILLLAVLLRGVRDSFGTMSTLGMGGLYLMLMGTWDLLFSPMADIDRLIAGLIVSMIAIRSGSQLDRTASEMARGRIPDHASVSTPREHVETRGNIPPDRRSS